MTASLTETSTEATAPSRCQCLHPMPWGEEPCGEEADLEAVVDERCVLLCVECLEAWRDSDRNRYGEVRLVIREL